MKHRVLKKQNTIVIRLNPKLYSMEAVLGSCYVFIDRAYIFLDGDPKKEIKIFIKAKQKLPSKKLEAIVGEFQNELLNYALRERINKSNRKVREYIIGKALFYEASELGSEKEDEVFDYEEDPLDIAIPWEEKYGKSKV
jgi:His-Xaa-Ser system protein HxsD